MKGNYRITDKECLKILYIINKILTEEEIPYAIVGGMGIQAILASKRLEHLLRTSGDIDLAIDAELSDITRAFNNISLNYPELKVRHDYRRQHVLINNLGIDYVTNPDKLKEMENIFKKAIKEAEEIKVRNISVKIESPEYLIAAKLTGKKLRETDKEDILNLLRSGIQINHGLIYRFAKNYTTRINWYNEIKELVEKKEI